MHRLRRTASGWATTFDPNRYKSGGKLAADLKDARTGEIKAEAGAKMTPRLARKLKEDGLVEVLVADDELLGQYLAQDVINVQTGEIYAEAGDELGQALLDQLPGVGIEELPVLAVDSLNIAAYIRNTMMIDKNQSREDALIDIYRVMRPGEPPTLETAEALFRSLFFDSERYDLSAVGRGKLNSRLGIKAEDTVRTLRKEDILAILKVLVELKDGRGEIDDIDNLGNRR